MTHDVFISYSSKDKPIADGICANLEAAGTRCWIAPRDIHPGEDWPTAITTAITHSRVMVLVFSADSNSSKQVGNEISLAFNNNLIIIPFKIENIEPEPGKQYYLGRTHWLEAMNPPTAEQIQILVERVRVIVPPLELNTIVQPIPVPAPLIEQYSTPNLRRKKNWFRWKNLWIGVTLLLIILIVSIWPKFQGLIAKPMVTPTLTATETFQPSSTVTLSPTNTRANTAIPTANATAKATATLISGALYSDDFENELSGWRQEDNSDGQIRYSAGKYLISFVKGDFLGWSCSYNIFTDAVLTIDTIHIAGNVNFTGPGIIWRFVDSNNYYLLRLFGNGTWRIDKSINGEWKEIYVSTIDSKYNSGQNLIKIAISFNGGTSEIYINDKFMTSFQDSSFNSGDICLVANSSASTGVEVSFDNLVVYSIDSWDNPK
jgi:hypothetical protein